MIARLREWADDAVNPLLVREIQRTLRGRAFLAGFIGLMVAFLFAGMFAVEDRDLRNFRAGGQEVFPWLVGIYAFFAWMAVPFYGARWIWEERRDDTFPILSITTLGAWRMVLGRLSAGLVQLLLFLSILTPFATFAYLLRGIDLIFMVEMLVSVVAVSVLLLLAGIFLSTLAANRVAFGFLALVFVGGLFTVFVGGMGVLGELLRFGGGRTPDGFLAGVLAGSIPLSAILACASRASLAPATTNFSASVRAAVVATIAIWLGAYVGIPYLATGTTVRPGDEIHLWSLPALGLVAALGLAVLGEPENLSRRVRWQAARFVRGRVRLQILLSWFFTHRGTGFGLFVLLSMLVGAVHIVLGDPADLHADRLAVPILAAYAVVFYGLGLFVGRHLLPPIHRIPRNLRLTPLLMAGAASIVALVFQLFLTDFYARGVQIPDLLSPVTAIGKLHRTDGLPAMGVLMVVGVAAAIAVAINLDVIAKGVWQVTSAKRDPGA